jgi:predicted mannosyl-3-phosphoglycerate phosphatase (HAD superfamily)
MSMRPQTYTERAHHCEQMAFRVRNAEAKSKFVQLARQWHARAAQEGESRAPDAAAAAQG